MSLKINHNPLFCREDIQTKFDIADYKYVCTSATYHAADFCLDVYYSEKTNKKYNSNYVGFFKQNDVIITVVNVDNIENLNFILFSDLNNTYYYSRFFGDQIHFGDQNSNGRRQTWEDLENKSNAILTKINNGCYIKYKQ